MKQKIKHIEKAENLFNKLGYSKIWCNEGFFYFNSDKNKCVLFDIKKKEWSVYDYDTLESRGYSDELLNAIFLQEYELNWLSYEQYQIELKSIF